MEMQSMYNEKKSVVTKKFIRTLKNKIYRLWQLFQEMLILIC